MVISSDGVDFTITNTFITIPRTAENGTEMCFTFANVIDDQRIEDTETAYFVLTSNNFADVSRDSTFSIDIIDDDCKSDNHLSMHTVLIEILHILVYNYMPHQITIFVPQCKGM